MLNNAGEKSFWELSYEELESYDFKKAIVREREKQYKKNGRFYLEDDTDQDSLAEYYDLDKTRSVIEKLYPSMDPDALPSWHDPLFQSIMRNPDQKDCLPYFIYRRAYLERIGYTIHCKESIEHLDRFLKSLGVKSFVELDAGYGVLSLLLKKLGYKGRGYTLAIEDENKMVHGNLPRRAEPTIFEKEALESGALVYQDIRNLYLDEAPDVVLASWIPYLGGEEVIEFFEHQWERGIKPAYFILIREERGATQSELFLEWLFMRNKDTIKRIWTCYTWSSLVEVCECYKLTE